MIHLKIKKNMSLEDYTNYCSRTLLNLIEKCLLVNGFTRFQVLSSDGGVFDIVDQEKGINLRIHFAIDHLIKTNTIIVSISCEEDNLFKKGFYLDDEFSEKDFKDGFDIDKYLEKANDLIEELTNIM